MNPTVSARASAACLLVCAMAIGAPAQADQRAANNRPQRQLFKADARAPPREPAHEIAATLTLWPGCDPSCNAADETVRTTHPLTSGLLARQMAGAKALRPLAGAAVGGGLGLLVGATWSSMEGEEFSVPAGAFFGGVGAVTGGVSTLVANRMLQRRDAPSVLKSVLVGAAVGSAIWAGAGALAQLDNRPGDAAKVLAVVGFGHAGLTTAIMLVR